MISPVRAVIFDSTKCALSPFHWTETALLCALSDILKAADSGDVAGLVLLDLSAAFDTVDHDILFRRLNTSYGFKGTAIQWFRSYLTRRLQYVRRGSVKASIVWLVCGVPQGSLLGPVLFVLYTADLIHLIERQSSSASLCGRYSSLRFLLTG
jgi:hypothetical protein